MNRLTPKRMIILSGLLLVGCCQDYSYIPNDERATQLPQNQYNRQPMATKKYPDVYVVNNTPHTRKQPLDNKYHEGHKPKNIGLVGMDGELL